MSTEIQTPEQWYPIVNNIASERGLALLLGTVDTGKSTLAKFLVSEISRRGIKVALVDADIGQAFLGPPTTIGLSFFDSPPDWGNTSAQEIYFVGATSPDQNFSLHLTGTKVMVKKAIAGGAEVMVVDTTGLVLGEFGKILKKRKIGLLSPRFLIALQRSGELEPILAAYQTDPQYRIWRLSPSEHARVRSMEERRVYRSKRFQRYFSGSMVFEVNTAAIELEGKVVSNGISVPFENAFSILGLLCGLKDERDQTLALGVIQHFERENRILQLLTPAADINRVRRLHLSSVRLTPAFEDERL
jgi:polynucleotide 5'-hydroxyl-kinase GRC3/NOL9